MKNLLLIPIWICSIVQVHSQTAEVLVNESVSRSYPNEPSIAINKKDGSHVVICANIDNQYTSNDSGKSWSHNRVETTFGMFGDPVLHAASDGRIYLTHLSKTSDPKKQKKHRFIDRMVIQVSEDGIKKFNNGSTVGYNQDKIQDKPWLSSDDERNKIYITWTEFDKLNSKSKKHKSRIRFSSSSDNGKTWKKAMTISDGTGDCVDDDHTLEGATTAVDANGNIYCVWAGHNKLYFDKSTNGGESWGVDKVIGQQESGWAMDVSHVYRTSGMPFLVCDNSNGRHKGRLYLVYGDTALGDADIFLMMSDDEGETWDAPKRVNQDPQGNGKSQYLPNMAIDQTNGDLAIIYYDRRKSHNNLFTDVVSAISKDGGATFREVQLNTIMTQPYGKNIFSGDYIDIDLHNGQVAAVWASLQNNQKLYSKVTSIDNLLQQGPNSLIGKQVTFYTNSEGKHIIFYVRLNQPAKVSYSYSYSKWFGLKKYSASIEDTIECADDGSETVEYGVKHPNARSYNFLLRMENDDGLIIQTKTLKR
jgi:hypothetical protein